MKPVFIYFKEIPFNDNNKFVLDFSDQEFIQKVYFDKNIDYYIATLDCNLILEEEIKKDKKFFFEELAQKSRLLLEKDADYQNDIGWMTSYIADYYNFSGFGVTYNFIFYPKIIDEYSYKYKFYDTVEKKLEIVKFIRCFLIIKEMDLNFKE